MTKKHSTKKALMASVLSLLLCFSMLIGTTFAWFTDSVTSANNIIKSGNIDVELYYQVEGQTSWTVVTENTNVFKADTLWEPGHTEVVKLKIVNKGSLALKYQLGVNVASEVGSVNVNNVEFKLSDFIKFGIVDGAQSYTRDQAIAAVDATATALKTAYNSAVTALEAKNDGNTDEKIVTMVVYMPTTVGNEANAKAGAAVPTINLGINLFATQYTAESDSFGSDYDAKNAVYTVADANSAMVAGESMVTLMGCNEPTGIVEIPEDYTGTLTIANSTVKSIQAAKDANIVILGNVVVNANGSGAATRAITEFDGSAITAKGALNISGSGSLTAIAADVNGAFGIGGLETKSILIKGVTVELAQGAYAYGVGTDTKYYKDAPEGGAAIGSGYDGAVITLDGATVVKAIGGSKTAGIGARYHVGVTVNVNNSVIAYVEGGVSAAGIGGSRISGERTESGTTINITSSDVTAKGGAYGAAIGSGYDTHCNDGQPLCTINIVDSTINATGGRYAAGVGTGYHHAALAGEINNSTVTAVSGEKVYKDAYTSAMDVGFGVVDPAREGKQVDSKIIFNGTKIRIPGCKVSTGAELVDAIANGKAVELTQDVTLGKIDLTGAITNDVVIDANGHKITTTDAYGIEVTAGKNVTVSNANVEMTKEGNYITYAAGFKIANGDYAGATITLENCTITMANTDWAYAVTMPASVKNLNLVIDNCTLEGAVAVQCWGDNNTITITNSKLICNYTTNALYTSYCVALQGDGTNNSENNTLVIDNCEFLYSGIDNFNSSIYAAIDVCKGNTGNTVTVTNCTYGEKVVAK